MSGRLLRNVAIVGFSTVVLLLGITLWALEWSDVAVLESTARDGSVRTTRVWYVFDERGSLLVEAGAVASPWLEDVRANPELRVDIDGEAANYRASIRANPDGHSEIRRRLRARYGLRDAWIAWLFDTSTSFEVELEPLDAPR